MRHLTGPAGWRFQFRLPVATFPTDSTLAGNRVTIRKYLGPLPIRVAAARARLLATLCVLATELIVKSSGFPKMRDVTEEEDLLVRVIAACNEVIGAAINNPAEALSLANRIGPVLATLSLVANEAAKGPDGIGSVVDNAPGLTRGALADFLALAGVPVDPAGISTEAMLANLRPPSEEAVSSAEGSALRGGLTAPPPGAGTMPLFSTVARAYIRMRRDGGARR